ncbi:MAG: SOS response-associated peptidase [Saprospiraceae bacterium]|nr:SOS response-associated peptidase [Saprospiraceae bacterium]
MCGRFSFSTSKEKLQQQFGEIETGSNLRINFNVAPTQHSYVVTNDSPNRLQYITWGLIPHWSNDGKNTGKLINARMEGIATKPSFRLPIRKRRCWVIADSFYEWRKDGNQKIPYRIMLKNGELLVMAGIWDVWYKGDYAIKSFSIITAPPNKEMSPFHDRMPIIFTDKTQQQRWLEDIDVDEVLTLMNTPKDDILNIYRVSEKVNSVINNSSELHEPVPETPKLF